MLVQHSQVATTDDSFWFLTQQVRIRATHKKHRTWQSYGISIFSLCQPVELEKSVFTTTILHIEMGDTDRDTDRYVEKVEKSTHIYNMPLLNMMALHRLVVELHTSLDSASSHFSETLAWHRDTRFIKQIKQHWLLLSWQQCIHQNRRTLYKVHVTIDIIVLPEFKML